MKFNLHWRLRKTMLPYQQTVSSPVCALYLLLFLLADREVQVIVICGLSRISL